MKNKGVKTIKMRLTPSSFLICGRIKLPHVNMNVKIKYLDRQKKIIKYSIPTRSLKFYTVHEKVLETQDLSFLKISFISSVHLRYNPKLSLLMRSKTSII